MKLHIARLLAAVLFPFLMTGHSRQSNFQGIVHDAAGAVLPGAAVIVQRWEWDPSTKHARLVTQPPVYTDDHGRFSVYLPFGFYDVFVSFIGLEPVAKKVEVKPVTPTNLDCELELSPVTPITGGLRVYPTGPKAEMPGPRTRSSRGCIDRGPQ